MSGVSESESGTPTPDAAINHDYSKPKKNNYTTRPLTWNGDSTEF